MIPFHRTFGVMKREVAYVNANVVGDAPKVEVQAWAVGLEGGVFPCPEVWMLNVERLGEIVSVLQAAHEEALERIVPERAAATVVDPAEYLDWEGLAGMPLPSDENAP